MTLDGTEREATLVDTTVTTKSVGKSHFVQSVKSAAIAYNQTTHFSQTSQVKTTTHPATLADGLIIQGNSILKGTELHLEISNLTYTPYNFMQRLHSATDQYTFDYQTNLTNPSQPLDQLYNPKAFQWQWLKENATTIGPQISNYTMSVGYRGRTLTFTQTGQNNLSFYDPKTSLTINLGTAKSPTKQAYLPITFDRPGTYSFKAKIVAIPVDKRFDAAATTRQQTAVPYKLGHNQVTLDTTKVQGQLVTSTLPFSMGWHSKQAKISQVNLGFVGIQVPKGTKTVTLTYATPGLRWSLYASLVTVLVFLLAVSFTKRQQ
jgi:uncharacterized membrane protein YfhO